MSVKVRIALDAMGGDNAPDEIVKGALETVNKEQDIDITLVGDEKKITPLLKGTSYPKERLHIRHASEVIETADPPVASIRTKKDSSIVVAMKMVKNGEADAFASAGSSGAILVGGQVIVGRIRGIERAPFAGIIPTKAGFSLLLDCGANVDARSDHLVQFARMGTIYMRDVMGVKDPTVGIVNIGAEEEKGNALVKETFPLLKECQDIHFIGSVEARDIPAGGTDVVVCEAFTGNVVLKMYEGTAATLLSVIKEGIMGSLRTKIGGLLIKPALKKILKTYDASRYGGAPLLGLNSLVIKMHGTVKAADVYQVMVQCRRFHEKRISEKLKETLL